MDYSPKNGSVTRLNLHRRLDLHLTPLTLRDAKRRIARAIGIDENISNNALHVLFGPDEYANVARIGRRT